MTWPNKHQSRIVG